MKKAGFLFLVIFFASCAINEKKADPREALKAAMVDFLYKSNSYDSSKVKYRAEEVIYYEDVKYYDCEFKVKMLREGFPDTAGSMRAFISKDFKEVKRTY